MIKIAVVRFSTLACCAFAGESTQAKVSEFLPTTSGGINRPSFPVLIRRIGTGKLGAPKRAPAIAIEVRLTIGTQALLEIRVGAL